MGLCRSCMQLSGYLMQPYGLHMQFNFRLPKSLYYYEIQVSGSFAKIFFSSELHQVFRAFLDAKYIPKYTKTYKTAPLSWNASMQQILQPATVRSIFKSYISKLYFLFSNFLIIYCVFVFVQQSAGLIIRVYF